MMPAVYDMTVVEFDLGRYLFRATGSVMIFDGYHILYTEGREGRGVGSYTVTGNRLEIQPGPKSFFRNGQMFKAGET
jgi:DNA topoisomerase IA